MGARDTMPATSARRPKDRKAQLATIGAELFGERGYHAVSLDEIAAAAGITGPAIYRHFRNKQAILAHAAQEFAGALHQCVADAATAHTPADRLDALLRAVTALVTDGRMATRIYQWERRHLDPADQSNLDAALRAVRSAAYQHLQGARPALDADQAHLLGLAALSALSSLATHRTVISRSAAERLLLSAAHAVVRCELELGSPGMPPPVAPVPDSRREQLLFAAVRLFERNGFHGVSMEDIGKAVGINGSSVYRHFPGKADLLAAIYYRATERVAAGTEVALAGATDSADALRRLADAYVRMTSGQRSLIAVYLSEVENLPESAHKALRRAQRDHVDRWFRLLAELRPELSTAQVKVLVHAALNIVNDVSQVRRPITGSPDEVTQLALTVLYTDVG